MIVLKFLMYRVPNKIYFVPYFDSTSLHFENVMYLVLCTCDKLLSIAPVQKDISSVTKNYRFLNF